MDLEIAIVGVGLARKEALQLSASRLRAQQFERCFGIGDHVGFALGLAQLDQVDRFCDLALDPLVAANRLVEPCALTEQLLRRGRIIPQARVLGLRVQLGEPAGCGVPVKDASSAAPATC
jgi:hypothetical protein